MKMPPCTNSDLRRIKSLVGIKVIEVPQSFYGGIVLSGPGRVVKTDRYIWGTLELTRAGRVKAITVWDKLCNTKKLCTILHEKGHMECYESGCGCNWYTNTEGFKLTESHADFRAIQYLLAMEFDRYINYYIKEFSRVKGKTNNYLMSIIRAWRGGNTKVWNSLC